jgi:predicted DNA-binding ribbon-helix-helix protein
VKENFSSKLRTCVRKKLRKRKDLFIKNNISGNINSTGRKIKTYVSFMVGAITQEGALLGAKF